MQVNTNTQMSIVKNNHMRVVTKNWKDAKRIAYLETAILELLLKNENSVLHEFAKKMGVTPRQILEPNKSDYICDIRHLYCYLRCKVHKESYSAVGLEINRSHTAVSKGVKRIENLFELKYKNIEVKWNKVKNISEKGKYRTMHEHR